MLNFVKNLGGKSLAKGSLDDQKSTKIKGFASGFLKINTLM
jgi:hypothetical protein